MGPYKSRIGIFNRGRRRMLGSQPVVDRQYLDVGVATGQPAQRVMGVQVPERPAATVVKTSSGVAPPPLGR